jgi:bacillolysin
MKTRKAFYGLIAFIFLAGLVSGLLARPSAAQPSNPVEMLRQQTDGTARISYHAETGKVRFIGTDLSHPIPQPVALEAEATAEDAARQFLGSYGSLFGLDDQAQELTVERAMATEDGRSVVRFQQVYHGIPVVGGELIVQMNAKKQVLSVNGEVLPEINLDVIPRMDVETARQRALATVADAYGVNTSDLVATQPELWLFNQSLLGGPGPRITSLVWRVEVTPVELLPIRELVLVDAQRGLIALHFNQIDTAKNRETYTVDNGTTLPGTLVCNESNPNCTTGDNDAQKAHIYAGSTYDFYLTNHGRDSINNSGMTLISSVHYRSGYANAFWNGTQMVYGDAYGFANADDVIAHELTHGVTDYESGLFYYYQPGALSESFSDIWGEFVDQTNGLGDDSVGVKWLMGEDVTGLGAIRSMSNPPAYGDPDMTSSANYTCDPTEEDNGGVHTNSGVANKAAFLMVDGGSFNGQTITGLGITKVAKIFYEVQTHLFTSASDFQDLYDDLQQACLTLVGTSGITSADCQEVNKAALAVQLNTQPVGCTSPEAAMTCPVGQAPSDIFYDNMENTGSGNWGSSAVLGSNNWFYPQNPNVLGYDMTYATSGSTNIWAYDQPGASNTSMRMQKNVTLPAATTTYLHFNHSYGFQGASADGGTLEYSTDGGTNWNDIGVLPIVNGYNGTITGSGNPLNGRQGFIGESHGYISTQVNLTSLAGQNVRFAFHMGTDSVTTSDDWGWYIDDVRVYRCAAFAGRQFLPLTIKGGQPGPTPTLTPTPTSTPSAGGWQTIIEETFEGTFPGSWQVSDNYAYGTGEYFWGKRNCLAYAGSFSGWAVGAGADGSGLACGSDYPDDAYSWMVYGPFSLVGATDADLTFKLWLNSESGYDGVCRYASVDNYYYYGWCTRGNSAGWIDKELDLTNVSPPDMGDLRGQPNVWIAITFESDYSGTYPVGGYVDNILLRKCPGGTCPALLKSTVNSDQVSDTPSSIQFSR